jgi:hypothetical protein
MVAGYSAKGEVIMQDQIDLFSEEAVKRAKGKLKDSNRSYSVGYSYSKQNGYVLELRILVSAEDFDNKNFPNDYPTTFGGFPVNTEFQKGVSFL